ncbi:hypothetical protein BD779DRAFT_1188212 [Infundibulicybe gibba]|nr:hypothetical protein BD779DRAFT_1188212 [Infundibulicybe gibba]
MFTAPLSKLAFYLHIFAWSFRCLLAAPSSSVKCVTEWAYNSVGQSPCLVAAYLQAICFDGRYTIPQLTNGTTYSGPVTDNGCQCNSVVYSLVSACADCQAQQFIKWTDWGKTCQTAFVNAFPYTIPPQTAIPGWAYINMTNLGSFDVPKAQSLAVLNTPESTGPGYIFGTPTPGGGSSTSVSTSALISASSGPDTVSTPKQSHMTPAIWSIIGAVIGGIVVMLLIASYFSPGVGAAKDV